MHISFAMILVGMLATVGCSLEPVDIELSWPHYVELCACSDSPGEDEVAAWKRCNDQVRTEVVASWQALEEGQRTVIVLQDGEVEQRWSINPDGQDFYRQELAGQQSDSDSIQTSIFWHYDRTMTFECGQTHVDRPGLTLRWSGQKQVL